MQVRRPDNPDNDPDVADFLAALKAVGGRSHRSIAAEADVAHSYLRRVISGQLKTPSFKLVQRLRAVRGLETVFSRLYPIDGAPSPVLKARTQQPKIRVSVEASAGLLRRSAELPPGRQIDLYPPIDPAEIARGAFGVRVRAPGAEYLYPEDSLLACLPIAAVARPLKTHDQLLLQRMEGPRCELTLRELTVEGNEAWLWLRSSHPHYQTPVRMPYAPGRPLKTWQVKHDTNSLLDSFFNVIGLVIWAGVPRS